MQADYGGKANSLNHTSQPPIFRDGIIQQFLFYYPSFTTCMLQR
jgi:hypothetical protein